MVTLDQSLLPVDEEQRLAAVRRYDILDTPPEGAFDGIAAVAAKIFDVPIAIISLVDEDRIWFKSHHGLDVAQVGRDPGLCASAILQIDPWIVTDAEHDVRALANPLVTGEFGLRFYAAALLRTSDGFNLGTLCVIDRQPRIASQAQIALLQDLASAVMDQMELRLSARRTISEYSMALAEMEKTLRHSEVMAREADHRIKNSLQLVASLLNVQSRSLGASDAAEELSKAANRIHAIARVHEHIYSGEGGATTECRAYFQRECDDLADMLGLSDRDQIAVDAIEAELPTERIIPLGLILNELVMNAAKHGVGKITVKFERTASGKFALTVTDDGAGLSDDFEPSATASGLGMKVICSLVKKIGGQLVVGNSTRSRGAEFTVQLSDE
jgi:two-component sensor histidine kinase